ncbi:MAG: FG-GAP-like repeat-containing protein, partial [Candidatus Glassbacteria bacterium]
ETTPALVDIDNDGDLEIFVVSDIRLYAWHHDGSYVQGWLKIMGQYTNSTSSPAIGDIDGDGELEIVITCDHPTFSSITSKLYVFNYDGSYVSGFPITMLYTIFMGSEIVDLDGDGDLEIGVPTQYGDIFDRSPGYIYFWDLESEYHPERLIWPR